MTIQHVFLYVVENYMTALRRPPTEVARIAFAATQIPEWRLYDEGNVGGAGIEEKAVGFVIWCVESPKGEYPAPAWLTRERVVALCSECEVPYGNP